MSGIVQPPPLPLREAADQASVKADMELGVTVEATVIRAAPHKEMLSWIEVLEALIAELPKQRRGIGDNLQPITKEDVQEITHAIAILKVQPVVPTAPDDAKAAGSTLMRFGEQVGKYLLKQADVEVARRSFSMAMAFR
jgi:hypothetical protein